MAQKSQTWFFGFYSDPHASFWKEGKTPSLCIDWCMEDTSFFYCIVLRSSVTHTNTKRHEGKISANTTWNEITLRDATCAAAYLISDRHPYWLKIIWDIYLPYATPTVYGHMTPHPMKIEPHRDPTGSLKITYKKRNFLPIKKAIRLMRQDRRCRRRAQ